MKNTKIQHLLYCLCLLLEQLYIFTVYILKAHSKVWEIFDL